MSGSKMPDPFLQFSYLKREILGQVLKKYPDGKLTNRAFFKEIVPKFPKHRSGEVINAFFGMSEWKTENRVVYHQIRREWIIAMRTSTP